MSAQSWSSVVVVFLLSVPAVGFGQDVSLSAAARADKRLEVLPPSTRHVAIRFRDGVGIEDALSRLGLKQSASFPSGQVLAEGRFNRAVLLADPDVEHVGPVFGEGKQAHIPGNQLIVRFTEGTTTDEISKALDRFAFAEVRTRPTDATRRLCTLPWARAGELFEIVESLAGLPNVRYAIPNLAYFIELHGCADPTVPYTEYVPQQWYLGKIEAFSAWDVSYGWAVRVAVIDQGVDPQHEDLVGKVIGGWDSYDNDADPSPSCVNQGTHNAHGHGTAVAGIIAADYFGWTGIVGIAHGAQILSYRVCGQNGAIDDEAVADALYRAWAMDLADVINMSFGGPAGNADVELELDRARTFGRGGFGCVLVASTGNDGGPVSFPARHPGVIGVGAVDQDDQYLSFSNYGSQVDLVAFGENVFTTDVSGTCGYSPGSEPPGGSDAEYAPTFGGTSSAAPMVAAVAALILQERGDLSPDQIESILESSTDPAGGTTNQVGAGRVNARKAVIKTLELSGSTVVTSPAAGLVVQTGNVLNIAWSGCTDCGPYGNQKIYVSLNGGPPQFIAQVSGGATSYAWTVSCLSGGCIGQVAARIIVERCSESVAFTGQSALFTIQYPGQSNCFITDDHHQRLPIVTGDGSGGYLMAWQSENASGTQAETRLARLSAPGVIQWNQVAWASHTLGLVRPILTSDRAGGAYTAMDGTIRRFDGSGAPQLWSSAWPQGAGWTDNPRITTDPSGDVWVAARGYLATGPDWIRVARLRASDGGVTWYAEQTSATGLYPVQVAAHSGNAFVAFSTTDLLNLRAQKFNATGAPQWGTNGVLVRTWEGLRPNHAKIVEDGAGGCYILWPERVEVPDTDRWDVRMQHLNSSGAPQWGPAGALISSFLSTGEVYPNHLYLARYEGGDVLAAWSVASGQDQVFHARRIAGGPVPYTPVWGEDATFTFDLPWCGSCPFPWTLSELDAFEGASIVYGEQAGSPQAFRVSGRYVTRSGELSQELVLSEDPFLTTDPRPVTYANLGSIIGAWSVDYTTGTERNICGRTIQPKNLTGFTQIRGRVTLPAGCYPVVPAVEAVDLTGQTVHSTATPDGTGDYVLRLSASAAEAGFRVRLQLPADMSSNPPHYEFNTAAWRTGQDFNVSYTVPTAGWGTTPVPVTLTPPDAIDQQAVRAADGSLFVTWVEDRCGTGPDVYVQKFNVVGVAQWAPTGVPVSTLFGAQGHPAVVDDGSGGAFVVFERQFNNADVVAQHVNAAGNLLWGAGLVVCDEINNQEDIQLTTDTAGGMVAAWVDDRNLAYSSTSIYAQRVRADGTFAWPVDGLEICGAIGYQIAPTIASDGFGGAIIAWEDWREGVGSTDIYAQRVYAVGVLVWQVDGIPLATRDGDQSSPRAVPAGAAGAFVVWTDWGYTTAEIAAQHVASNGALQWTSAGTTVAASASQGSPDLCADGFGGIVVAWEKGSGSAVRAYAQRVNSSGATQWSSVGLPVATGNGKQTQVRVVAGGLGSMVTWTDERAGNKDIYSQRLNGAGTRQWGVGGRAVVASASSEYDPVLVARDNASAHVIWRQGAPADIYATLIVDDPPPGGGCTKNCPTESGLIAQGVESGIFSVRPNPFRFAADVHFVVAKSAEPEVRVFDLQGREVYADRLGEHPPGTWKWSWAGNNADGSRATSGIYFVQVRLGDDQYTRRVVKVGQ